MTIFIPAPLSNKAGELCYFICLFILWQPGSNQMCHSFFVFGIWHVVERSAEFLFTAPLLAIILLNEAVL